MGYMPDAREIIRRKREEGKEPIVIEDDDPFFHTYTGERTSLRTIRRVPVAFLTAQELEAWRKSKGEEAGRTWLRERKMWHCDQCESVYYPEIGHHCTAIDEGGGVMAKLSPWRFRHGRRVYHHSGALFPLTTIGTERMLCGYTYMIGPKDGVVIPGHAEFTTRLCRRCLAIMEDRKRMDNDL